MPSAASTLRTSPPIGAVIDIEAILSCWRRISTCNASIAASETWSSRAAISRSSASCRTCSSRSSMSRRRVRSAASRSLGGDTSAATSDFTSSRSAVASSISCPRSSIWRCLRSRSMRLCSRCLVSDRSASARSARRSSSASTRSVAASSARSRPASTRSPSCTYSAAADPASGLTSVICTGKTTVPEACVVCTRRPRFTSAAWYERRVYSSWRGPRTR